MEHEGGYTPFEADITDVVEPGAEARITAVVTLDVSLPGGLVEGSGTMTEARTLAFTTLVLAQLFNCFNARSERVSACHHLFTNRWLWAALASSLLLRLAVVYVPFLNRAFSTTALDPREWLLCIVMASTVLWADELRKLVGRRLPGPSPSTQTGASALSHAGGAPTHHVDTARAPVGRALMGPCLPAHAVTVLVDRHTVMARGARSRATDDVRRDTGRPPLSLSEFAAPGNRDRHRAPRASPRNFNRARSPRA